MDNYVVIDTMCPGSFGVTLFVKDREAGLDHTLKKALCLLNVNHSNFVRYRELFVSWDRNISSVMLSMVMDCPCVTSLKTVIDSHREKKKKFKKKIIQMFLGQMVDALAYLHNRDILHRNLKPSNILMTDALMFRIFDFGTATTTADRAKLQRRIKDSSKCWMAPESARLLQWSNKSDIWSLGCVLLDMLMCHMLDEEAFLSQLSQIRKDLTPLDSIRSKNLHKILSIMFNPNPNRRASVWILVNETFVKDCVILCGSSPNTMNKTPQGFTAPPFHEGFDSVLEFMMTYTDIEAVQLSVLSYLLQEERNVLERLSDVVEAVTFAMMSHSGSACVQLSSCQVLHYLLTAGQHSGKKDCLYGENVVSFVLKAVQNHPKHVELLENAFSVLFHISTNEKACEMLAKLGGIQVALNTLRTYPQKKGIVISSCKILRTALAIGSGAPDSLATALETVCSVGQMNLQDVVVTESLCAALKSLTMHGLYEEKHTETATHFLMRALRVHTCHSGVVNHVFAAMANLVKSSETAALRLLSPNDESGVPFILAVREHHSEDPKVTESFCCFLNQLIQHDAVVPKLLAENIQDVLEQTVKQFVSSAEIALLAQQTLSKVMSLNDVDPAVK
ncbi:serine/threonine kinase-like domain-containing protein STKLD1 isoform X2 [Hoplias malabaricus]|uniref:serine/threonine kinase-like domain-containing protein STKLD1 isoform X2 n=1 Tax=Hoplias malabaricus TaxID=27720 RepID=UPI003461F067